MSAEHTTERGAEWRGETLRCAYCGGAFVELRHHRAECLLPYCSHGCRLAVECASETGRAHVAHVSIEAMPSGGLDRAVWREQSAGVGATNFPEQTHHKASCAERDECGGRFDILVFLARIPQRQREIVIARAGGAKWCEIGGEGARGSFRNTLKHYPQLRAYFGTVGRK